MSKDHYQRPVALNHYHMKWKNTCKNRVAALKWSKQFTRGDKVIYLFSTGVVVCFFSIFLVVTSLFLFGDLELSDAWWGQLWWGYCILMLVISVGVTLWLAIGGFMDLKALFKRLNEVQRDADDDGTVT